VVLTPSIVIISTPSQSGITFVYWAALFVHLFGAVAWMGGILFLTGVTRPIFEYFGAATFDVALRIKVRFLGFTWMLVWTVLVTGIIILLWSTRFLLFDFSDTWRILAHLKILFFIVLFVLNLALRTTYREMDSASAEKVEGELLSQRDVLAWRTRTFEQMEVWCAIFLLLIVSWMQIL
jgi:putative copper export protein